MLHTVLHTDMFYIAMNRVCFKVKFFIYNQITTPLVEFIKFFNKVVIAFKISLHGNLANKNRVGVLSKETLLLPVSI